MPNRFNNRYSTESRWKATIKFIPSGIDFMVYSVRRLIFAPFVRIVFRRAQYSQTNRVKITECSYYYKIILTHTSDRSLVDQRQLWVRNLIDKFMTVGVYVLRIRSLSTSPKAIMSCCNSHKTDRNKTRSVQIWQYKPRWRVTIIGGNSSSLTVEAFSSGGIVLLEILLLETVLVTRKLFFFFFCEMQISVAYYRWMYK